MKNLPVARHERILCSWTSGEDAAIWELDEKRVGILTVDFITPVVDDPNVWGQIAAANSLSDVFAMGGRPFVALNVVGFPTKTLELHVLQSVLEGGLQKVREAGAFLLGGHSVQDDEPKYGLVVYGEGRKDILWQVTGAMEGDLLLLTKPLGTGVVATAIKADMIEDRRTEQEALRWMTTLNDIPLHMEEEAMRLVHSCTDVTGFGLVGHTLDMLSERTLDLALDVRSVPLLHGVVELAESGLIPAGTYSNRIEYSERVSGLERYEDSHTDMLFDAQTSGGLLLSVPERHGNDMLARLRNLGFHSTEVIGRFIPGGGVIRAVDSL